jgi:hypothetical protein
MEQIAVELRTLADKELFARLPNQKKRNREQAALDLEVEAHDLSLPISNNRPNYLGATDIPHAPQSVRHVEAIDRGPTTSPDAGVVKLAASDIASIAHPETEQLRHMLDDHDWDPPLFRHLNFPMYPASMDPVDWLV